MARHVKPVRIPDDVDQVARDLAAARYRNRALLGAYWRGFVARREGWPRLRNPYYDHRTDRGATTWSRSYRRAWFEGWKDGRPRGPGTSARTTF